MEGGSFCCVSSFELALRGTNRHQGNNLRLWKASGADPRLESGGFAYVTWRRLLSSCLAGPFSPHKNRSRAKHHCFLRVADSLEDDRSTMGHFAPHLLLLSVVFLFFVFAKGPNAGFSSAGSEGLNAVFFTHLVFPARAAVAPHTTFKQNGASSGLSSPLLCSSLPQALCLHVRPLRVASSSGTVRLPGR